MALAFGYFVFMLISVITAVKNDQIGLDLTVKSVLSELPDAELVIVDGSEKSLSLPVERKDIVVLRGRDRGISHAFNRGIMAAQGEFIVFINAGDWLEQGVGDEIHRDLSSGNRDYVIYPVYRRYLEKEHDTFSPRPNLLLFAMSVPHQGLFVRRSVFSEIGLFPLQKYSMDHYVALKLVSRRPKFIGQVGDIVVANYPVGGHSTKGGVKPFLQNVINVSKICPKYVFIALAVNIYLAVKSVLASS